MAVYLPSCEPLIQEGEWGGGKPEQPLSELDRRNIMILALCWNNSEDFAECFNRMQTLGSLKMDDSESMVKLWRYMPSLGVLKSITDTGGTYARISEVGWSVPIQEYQEVQHKFSRD
ncbi:hypothetical protein ACFLVF_03545 [Chloroflexota bacterium]